MDERLNSNQEQAIAELAFAKAGYILTNIMGINTPENRGLSANGKGEKLAIIVNEKTDPKVIAVFKNAAESQGIEYDEVNFDDHAVGLDRFTNGIFDVALCLGTEMRDIRGKIEKEAKKQRIRMPEMPGLNLETLAKSDSFIETAQAMRERANEWIKVLADATELHFTNGEGTDLKIFIDPSEPWFPEVIDFTHRPLTDEHVPNDNLPGGELYKNPLVDRTEGALVLSSYLDTDVMAEAIVDEPVILKFYMGKVVSIEGGEAANKLRNYLAEKSKEDAAAGKDPQDAYRLSEVSVGTNKRARSYEEGDVVTLEAEKLLRFHVAIGSAGQESGDYARERNMTDSGSHLDLTLPSIYKLEATYKDGSKRTLLGPAGIMDRYRISNSKA